MKNFKFLFATILMVNISYCAMQLSAQVTFDPTRMFFGDAPPFTGNDTLFMWDKEKIAFRGGRFIDAPTTFSSIGDYSFSYGLDNSANGIYSVSLGAEASASGARSFSVNGFAEEAFSVAIGGAARAGCVNCIAIGTNASAIGDINTFAIGTDIQSKVGNSITMGFKNAGYDTTGQAAQNHPLFRIGNGTLANNPSNSNAITITKDGRTGLGNIYPEADLHILQKNSSANSGLRLENQSNNKWWRFYTRSGANELALYNDTVGGGTTTVGEFDTSGSYGAPSDRRLKMDIVDLPYGLETALALRPKSYKFKHLANREKGNIGFIAQEAIEVVPELVKYNEEEDEYLMYYDGFSVIAINAIQDLNGIIENQQKEIDTLKQLVTELLLKVR